MPRPRPESGPRSGPSVPRPASYGPVGPAIPKPVVSPVRKQRQAQSNPQAAAKSYASSAPQVQVPPSARTVPFVMPEAMNYVDTSTLPGVYAASYPQPDTSTLAGVYAASYPGGVPPEVAAQAAVSPSEQAYQQAVIDALGTATRTPIGTKPDYIGLAAQIPSMNQAQIQSVETQRTIADLMREAGVADWQKFQPAAPAGGVYRSSFYDPVTGQWDWNGLNAAVASGKRIID